MAIYRTSRGRSVPHCHVGPHPRWPCERFEWTLAEREQQRQGMKHDFPHVVEIRPPSRKYNCFGYAYARAHAWFDEPDDFIKDDFSEVPMDEARRGDVLVYKSFGDFAHSAIVAEVKNGEIIKLRSKWGQRAAVIHRPLEVHPLFGEPVQLLRRNRRRHNT
jgi:hypothetical protein